MRRSFVTAAFLFIALSASALPPSARVNGTGSVIEGNSGLTQKSVTVVLSAPAPADAVGTYQTVDGTATVANNDYVPKSGQIFIPQGSSTSEPIVLEIVGDTRVEADETFQLVVDFVSGAQDPPPYTITITNDDFPSVTVSSPRLAEGNSGTTPMPFTVTLSAVAAVPVVAVYQTDPSPGTATSGVDYQLATGSVIFAPGQTTQTVNVNIIGDTTFEPDETFTLSVTPVGGPKATGTGTIVNDDRLPSRLTIVSGNNQQGLLGQKLPQPLVVQLFDDQGSPVSGATVGWKVTKGEAVLDPASGITDAQGRASTRVTLNSVGAVEVEASSSGLTATFTLGSATSFESRAQGPVAVPIARTLDTICARNEQTFSQVCRALSGLPNGELTPTLERVAPQESGAQSKVASEVVSAVTSGISARLTAVRAGVERFSVAGLSLDWHGRAIPVAAISKALFPFRSAQGAEGEEKDYSGWSVFLSGNLGSGERNGHDGQLGFDLKSRGIMAGVDRLFGDNIFGVSLNLMTLDSDLDSNVGSVDMNGYALSIYGSRGGLGASSSATDSGKGFRYDGMHIDGSITFGRNNYDSEHIVEITGMPTSRATSENDANIFAVAGVAGFEGHSGRTDFDFSLSGAWSRASIDDLTEEGSGPLILFVQGHDIDSLVGTAAFSVKSAWPVSFGTLLPNFRAELIHEFKDAARFVTARFVRDQLGTSFTVPLDQPDANYGKLAAGLQASFAHGFAAYVEVTQDVLRSDLKFRTIQFVLTKSF